jgi:hypothetical protein
MFHVEHNKQRLINENHTSMKRLFPILAFTCVASICQARTFEVGISSSLETFRWSNPSIPGYFKSIKSPVIPAQALFARYGINKWMFETNLSYLTIERHEFGYSENWDADSYYYSNTDLLHWFEWRQAIDYCIAGSKKPRAVKNFIGFDIIGVLMKDNYSFDEIIDSQTKDHYNTSYTDKGFSFGAGLHDRVSVLIVPHINISVAINWAIFSDYPPQGDMKLGASIGIGYVW